MSLRKRLAMSRALAMVVFVGLGGVGAVSCTAILGVDTETLENVCTTSASSLEPIQCGKGNCTTLLEPCDSRGLPRSKADCPPIPPEALSGMDACDDGQDNNCNGQIDEGCSCTPDPLVDVVQSCYSGNPEDLKHGVCKQGWQKCAKSSDANTWSPICEDEILPTLEVDDDYDNDCDGKINEGVPCTKEDRPCYPGPAHEVETVDGGATTRCQTGKQYCKDGKWGECVEFLEPIPEECNGIDDNCDGEIDNGIVGLGKTCDTGNAACPVGTIECVTEEIIVDGGTNYTLTYSKCVSSKSSQPEVCDGEDNDCDGIVDNGNPGGGQACTAPDKSGVCVKGTFTCTGGQLVCVSNVVPSMELCNGADDDCDGSTDEDNPEGNKACVTGQPGICSDGLTKCEAGALKCIVIVTAQQEVCDGKDNDCDGVTDDGTAEAGTPCSVPGLQGECAKGLKSCQNGLVICDQVKQSSPETCDNLDNNCDGSVDENNPGGGATCSVGGLFGICATGQVKCTNGALSCQQTVFPQTEICDGTDNNCNNQVDEVTAVACDTGKPGICAAGLTQCINGNSGCKQEIFPQTETCDGKDNDCDGTVDEMDPGGGGSCLVPGQQGECAKGVTHCQGGLLVCTQTNVSITETCDGKDNDCDGSADDGFNLGLMCSNGVGACKRDGVYVCNGSGGAMCNATPGMSQLETCNGIDDDCDGTIDNGFNVGALCSNGVGACKRDGNIVCNGSGGTTCNATPGTSQTETCNGIDDDCNTVVDDGNPGSGQFCPTGQFGECAPGTTNCSNGAVVCVPNKQPISEVCDGLDNNCNGTTDDGNPGGGPPCDTPLLGVCRAGTVNCNNGALVCNQNTQASTEVCDGLDNNCDGVVDNGFNVGALCSNGVGACKRDGNIVCNGAGGTMCNAIPGMPQSEACNGLDDNCDGTSDEGFNLGALCSNGVGACKRDGSVVCNAAGGTTCNAVPGMPQSEACNGLDDDCNMVVDDGNPGSGQFCPTGQLGECAPGTTNCSSGAIVCVPNKLPVSEVCDGKDNNCDGTTDEGNPGAGQPCDTPQIGVCKAGTTTCLSGVLACNQNVQPSTEVCDGLDNDCDGAFDEGDPGGGGQCLVPGQQGECAKGIWRCQGGALVCPQVTLPATETCDGLDNDCDGTADDGLNLGAVCSNGTGVCKKDGVVVCNGSGGTTCNAAAGTPQTETCNGLDDNCDGTADDGFNLGAVCSNGVGACKKDGVIVCNASGGTTCNAMAGTPQTEACNGVDDDCDGTIDNGFNLGTMCSVGIGACKKDGVIVCNASGGTTCDVTPGMPQTETCNGIDDDCDNAVDDGFNLGTVCSNGVGACKKDGVTVCNATGGTTCDAIPGMSQSETCNGVDDNCDGVIDDGFNLGAVCSSGSGACKKDGVTVCNTTGGTMCNAVPAMPQTEMCNGIDDDCDDTIDNGNPGGGGTCTTGQPGACSAGTNQCKNGTVVCMANGSSSPETCNNADDDCDGMVDNGNPGGGQSCTTSLLGICRDGTSACSAGMIVCNQTTMPMTEICNMLDDDCDGTVDDVASPLCCGPDGVQNGTETDIDCGGSCTTKCADGKHCVVNADCVSNDCVSGTCQTVSCSDGIKNGMETDVDCGGSCPNACKLLLLAASATQTMTASFPVDDASPAWSTANITTSKSDVDVALTMPKSSLGVAVIRDTATSPSGKLRYATWSSNAWATSFTEISNVGQIEGPPSLGASYGAAHIGYRKKLTGNNDRFYYGQFNGSTWSTIDEGVHPLVTNTAAFVPDVGALLDGTGLMLYVDQPAANQQLFVRQRTTANMWAGAVMLHDNVEENARPEIVTLTNGDVLVVYVATNGSAQIHARLRQGTTWNSSVISTPLGLRATGSNLSVTALPGGKAMLAFKRSSDSKPGVSIYNGVGWTSNNWSTSLVADTVMANSISVTRGMGGNVAELAFTDSTGNVQHTRYTGSSWTTPVVVAASMTSVAIASPPP